MVSAIISKIVVREGILGNVFIRLIIISY